MAPSFDDTAVNVGALRSTSVAVRLAAIRALRDAGPGPVRPFAEQISPLVEDADPEVRQLADDLVTQLGCKETLTTDREERNQALKCGATWKCLCAGFGIEALDTSSLPVTSGDYSPVWRRVKSVRRSSQPLLAEVEDWGEPKQHWRVRDALAFTPKALQGDVLIKFLREEDPELRASVLLALRRLVPIYWVRHADMVSATLADRSPQVRVAALVALFHLDACDLEVQVPSIVVALRDEFWPVRAAALQTLRKLRPEQLQRLSHDVLRCKLDPSLRVRSAAQRVLERLSPKVLADLACRGARGGASHEFCY